MNHAFTILAALLLAILAATSGSLIADLAQSPASLPFAALFLLALAHLFTALPGLFREMLTA